jgi:hypothetical protein
MSLTAPEDAASVLEQFVHDGKTYPNLDMHLYEPFKANCS